MKGWFESGKLTLPNSLCKFRSIDVNNNSHSLTEINFCELTDLWIRIWDALIVCVFSVSKLAIADDPSAAFVSYTGNDLFPSYIIATTTVDWNGDEQRAEDPELEDGETPIVGDENGSIGVDLRDVLEGAKIKVEMVGEGFLKRTRN